MINRRITKSKYHLIKLCNDYVSLNRENKNVYEIWSRHKKIDIIINIKTNFKINYY